MPPRHTERPHTEIEIPETQWGGGSEQWTRDRCTDILGVELNDTNDATTECLLDTDRDHTQRYTTHRERYTRHRAVGRGLD